MLSSKKEPEITVQDFISYDPARTTDTISETQFLAAHQTRLAQGIYKCGTAHRREIRIAAKWTFSLDMRNTAPNRTTQGQMLFSNGGILLSQRNTISF